MRIYRVEHADENGPYSIMGRDSYPRPAKLTTWATNLCFRHSDEMHPAPWRDGIGWMEESEVCGFVSRERLDEWFEDEFKDLASFGFEIKVYEVDELYVREGRKQCVFRRAMASQVDSIPITAPVTNLRAWLTSMGA